MRRSNRWAWFLAGAGMGAGVAALFLPRSGAEIRGDITDAANRAAGKLSELKDQGMDYLNRGVQQATETGKRVVEQVRGTGEGTTTSQRPGQIGGQGEQKFGT